MKLGFALILFLTSHIAAIKSERVTLIGSHLINAETDYKAFLLTNKLNAGSNVDVSLLASSSPTSKNFRNFDQDSFQEVEFGHPPPSNNYELKVSSTSRNKCLQQSVRLIKSTDRPVIFLQFNKPFYAIGDEFKFRIFVLNQKMLPYNGPQSVNVAIIDSRGHVMKKFENIQTSNFGVYENSLKIPDSQNLGKWKIQVSSADRKVTKMFNVEHPSEDDLEVYLDMSPMVSYSDRKVFMNIFVKDKLNKFFTGTANIIASGRPTGSNRIQFDKLVKTVDIVGSKTGIAIDYQTELGISSPTNDMMIKFDVEVIDPATQRSVKISKEVEMKYNTRNTIHVIRKKFYKPGFKYSMKVRVKTFDGKMDNSFDKLSMSVEYHNTNEGTRRTTVDKKEFLMNLKNGEVSTQLNPTTETTQIIVNLEFAGAKLTEVIKPLPSLGTDEYMQVSVTNKGTTVGDKVQYQAQSSGEMETLHVLVIGLNGIVHYEEFPDAVGKDIFNFAVQLTEEMKPESRGIAFYVRPSDGVIVYDEFVISLSFSIENLLEISAAETGKPNEQINLDVKTSKGALVFLTASDQVSPQLIRDNEISRADIYNELVYYLNFKFPNTSLYNFEKFNGFILQPLTEGHTCGRESARYSNSELDEEDKSSSEIKYFPNVWFDESYQATSDNVKSMTFNLPNSLTTWKYYGISVHPTKGFTVVKVQPKTAVKTDIAVQVKSPKSASEDEVVWVDVNVFNTLQDNLRSNVFVELENGVFVEDVPKTEFNIKCVKYNPTNRKDGQLKMDLPAVKKSTTATFPIKSNGRGNMSVKVRAVAGSYNDEVTKKIKIEQVDEPIGTNSNFDTKVTTQPMQNNEVKILVDFKVLRKDITASSIIVLEVELPRGYKYNGHEQNNKIVSFEYQKDSNTVTFFLDKLGPNQIHRQVIRASKAYDFDYHRPSAVNIYDYNRLNIKDVSHYKYDKNVDACDRIEVIRWINKAKQVQDVTQEAQRAVQNSRNDVERAQQQVIDAQNKLKQAQENVQKAQEKAVDADKKAEEAFSTAEDAWRVAEEARQPNEVQSFVPVYPGSTTDESRDVPPLNAADAQEIAREAQRVADKAQDEAAEAEDVVSLAQEDVNAAKSDVTKAIEELKNAQKEARETREEAERVQKEAQEANLIVADSKNKVQTAQRNVDATRKVAENALVKFDKIQLEVDDAKVAADDAFARANAAKKYLEVEQLITNAIQRSQGAQKNAQNAQREADVVTQLIEQPLRAAEQERRNVEELYNRCNNIQNKAKYVDAKALTVQRKANTGKGNAEKVQKLVEEATRNFEQAKSNAVFAKNKANQARQIAQTKAREAKQMYDRENTFTTQVTKKTTTPRPIPTRAPPNRFTYAPATQPYQPSTVRPIIDQTQPSVRDDGYAPESDETNCSKWYRFCRFGF